MLLPIHPSIFVYLFLRHWTFYFLRTQLPLYISLPPREENYAVIRHCFKAPAFLMCYKIIKKYKKWSEKYRLLLHHGLFYSRKPSKANKKAQQRQKATTARLRGMWCDNLTLPSHTFSLALTKSSTARPGAHTHREQAPTKGIKCENKKEKWFRLEWEEIFRIKKKMTHHKTKEKPGRRQSGGNHLRRFVINIIMSFYAFSLSFP